MDKQQHEENIRRIMRLVLHEAPRLQYHNAQHAVEVWNSARQYAIMEGVNYEDKQTLELSALLHDIIVEPNRTDNEEKSAEYAGVYLPNLGYSKNQTADAQKIILATKMPQNPKTPLDRIMCDSDLDNLGAPTFLEKGEALRQELRLPKDIGWYHRQLEFVQGHDYWTESARNFRNTGKQENIQKLQDILVAAEAYRHLV